MIPKKMYDESMGRSLVGGTAGTVQVTSYLVAFGHFDKRGHRGGARFKDSETAGMKDAS